MESIQGPNKIVLVVLLYMYMNNNVYVCCYATCVPEANFSQETIKNNLITYHILIHFTF